MRSFYSAVEPSGHAAVETSSSPHIVEVTAPRATSPSARVAVYDDGPAAPRVVDVLAPSVSEFIESASDTVYSLAREAGGPLPYTAIREIVENYIHAGFSEPVISIMDSGHTIRFADQGPGIADKDRAVLPGFTTATSAMKSVIRGVGSGLPIVREYLEVTGGSLRIEDNLGRGSVVTISISSPSAPVSVTTGQVRQSSTVGETGSLPGMPGAKSPLRLSSRQKRVLALVLEQGSVGPSLVSKELGIAVSTAHRDLELLEEVGFIASDEGGKRCLTDRGVSAAESILRS